MMLPPPCSTMEIHDGSSRDIMGRLAVSLLSYLGGQDDFRGIRLKGAEYKCSPHFLEKGGNPCIIVLPLHNYAPLCVCISHNTLKYIEVCGCNVAICRKVHGV
ncbi:hypothetical protein CHARACLAT_025326 [Characodon lateralis]|uniref:Uncharacterized protein n=1 Tax=Characodon lateralis TaxID=208331 RepID=A0ABU7EM59_9TELE|nr:hypothetical protein [Characodon lateralis]